jgi:hypothetical protein
VAPVNWLYPVNEHSDYYLKGQRGEELPVTPHNLWAEVQANPDRSDSWYLSSGFRLMRRDDLVWIYSAGVHQFICALGTVVRLEQDVHGDWHAILLWDVKATRALQKQPIAQSDFHEIPQHPQRANPATATYLDRWLARHGVQHSAGDEQPVSVDDARRRVLAEIVQRQGQTQFRRQLLSNYGGRCCATGEAAEAVLEAAHIAPYLGTKSNRPSNGLLLRADIHTLFDLRLIAIDARGRWAVSSQLDGTSYAALRGKKPRAPKADPPSRAELARHFTKFHA